MRRICFGAGVGEYMKNAFLCQQKKTMGSDLEIALSDFQKAAASPIDKLAV